MNSFVDSRIIEELWLTEPHDLWVARTLLRIPETLIAESTDLPQLIYRAYDSLKQNDNEYVQAYNGARAELVIKLVDPPAVIDKRILGIEVEPSDDISYWLATHVLGYTDEELQILCGPYDSDDIKLALIPLVKQTYRRMRKLKIEDPVWQHFHKMKHNMVLYFLDAVYHEI